MPLHLRVYQLPLILVQYIGTDFGVFDKLQFVDIELESFFVVVEFVEERSVRSSPLVVPVADLFHGYERDAPAQPPSQILLDAFGQVALRVLHDPRLQSQPRQLVDVGQLHLQVEEAKD